MDWKRFDLAYYLDRSDHGDALLSIETSKGVALNLVLPPDWKESLDKLNRIRAVHGTTALEGNPLLTCPLQTGPVYQ